MCLSRSGVRIISGLSRALMMNGAIAFTSCTSISSTAGTSAISRRQEFRPRRSTCCRSWSSRPSGKRWSCSSCSSGSSGTCDSAAAWLRPSAPAMRRSGPTFATSPSGSRLTPRHPSYAPSSRRAGSGSCTERRRLQRHHVAVELGRAPHRLAGIVDDEVEPVAFVPPAGGRTPRRSACAAGRARRSPAGRSTPRSRARRRSASPNRAGSAW